MHDDPVTGVIGDLGGQNIAEPNYHSEMRHQFHVWKERLGGLDYVGFEHYRRAFFINPFTGLQLRRLDLELTRIQKVFISTHNVIEGCKPSVFDSYIELRASFPLEMKRHVDAMMRSNDLVVQRMTNWKIDDQWREHHPNDEWQIMLSAIRKTRFYAQSGAMIDFELQNAFYCNMYIMRSELFVEYMEFWSEIMLTLGDSVERRERYFGYFAERLINFFVYGKRLQDPGFRLATLPYLLRYFF